MSDSPLGSGRAPGGEGPTSRDGTPSDGREELDRGLRQAFAAARLPGAPDTLRASLVRIPSTNPRSRVVPGWWRRSGAVRFIPIAATAVVVVALIGAGLAGRAPGPGATTLPTVTVGPTATSPAGTTQPSAASNSPLTAIPWVDASPPPEPGEPTPRPVPPGTRTCQPADLAAFAGWSGATGTMAGGVNVTNVSSSPCVLDGPPRLVVIKAGTKTMATVYHASIGGGPAGTTPPGPGLLEPGDRGGWWLFWQNWCGRALIPTTVVVTLPAGGGTIVAKPDPQNPTPGIGGTPRCDAPGSPSTLAATAFEYLPPEPPLVEGQAASMAISAPATATIGQDVTFTVTLTNLGTSPALLDPCPTYSEDILVGGVRLKRPADREYALNCPAIGPSIAAGATIVLEMRYPIPSFVAPGPAELLWSMDPGGPFDSGAFGRVPIEIVSAAAP